MNENYLFFEKRLDEYYEEKKECLKNDVENIKDESTLADLDTLAADFSQNYQLKLAELGNEKESLRTIEEIRVEQTCLTGRAIVSDGIRVNYFFPIKGNAEIFSYKRKSIINYSDDPKGEIKSINNDSFLVLSYEDTFANAQEITNRMTKELAIIREFLYYVISDIKKFNEELNTYAHTLLGKRKISLEQFAKAKNHF